MPRSSKPVKPKPKTARPAKAPKRPAGVSPRAEWVSAASEWVECARNDGEFHGPARVWRATGEFCEQLSFQRGQPHGAKTRFFEDGQVAQEELYDQGVLLKHVGHRPKGATVDPHPFATLPGAVRIELGFDAEGLQTKQALFTAEGLEVLEDGRPAPPRPRGVTSGAYPRVVDRAIVWEQSAARQGEYKGLSLIWAENGALVAAYFHAQLGKSPTAWTDVRQPNQRRGGDSLVVALALAGREADLAQACALGLHGAPGAALHAALAGHSGLAKRIADEAPSPVLEGPEAPPRGEAPPEARWVPGLGAFMLGELEDATGMARGQWTVWPVAGATKPEGFSKLFRGAAEKTDTRLELGFERGRLASVIAREPAVDRSERSGGGLARNESEPPSGVRTVRWSGDEFTSFDSKVRGAQVFTSVREGRALVHRFFDDAAVAAEARSEGDALRGEVRTFDERGAVRSVVPIRLPVATTFAHDLKVAALRNLVEELVYQHAAARGADDAALAGSAAIDWQDLESAFMLGDLSKALAVLAVPESFVHHRALLTIVREVEHQGTVYPATAAIMPFLLRLLDSPNAPAAAILDVVHRVAVAASPYAHECLAAERAKRLEEHHRTVLVTLRAMTAAAELLGRLSRRATPAMRTVIEQVVKLAATAAPA